MDARMISRAAAAWGLALFVTAACAAEAPAGAPLRKPKAFPPVSGGPAHPLYATVPMDTWTGSVAYLMVEGSSSGGFARVFAWIPGDARFGRPVEWKPKTVENNPNAWNFGELENKAQEGDEKIRLLWRFYSVKESHGARTDTHFDYVTGKTVTRSVNASSGHRLRYGVSLGYLYGAGPAASMDGGYPLEMSDGDDLRLYSTWEQVPEPGGGLFGATIRARHEMQETRDPKTGRLLCLFDGFEGASIKKAPPEMDVALTVTPYMGEAVYSNAVTLGDFMKTGFDVSVPYGWYTLRLRGFRYGRFGFGGHFHRIGFDPVPLTRASAGEK